MKINAGACHQDGVYAITYITMKLKGTGVTSLMLP